MRTPRAMECVCGDRKDTLSTTTAFTTMRMVTTRRKVRYLPGGVGRRQGWPSGTALPDATATLSGCSPQVPRGGGGGRGVVSTKGGEEDGSRRENQAYLLMSGTAWEVSGTFLATRKRKTVWARSTLMATVHFWPPAARDGEARRADLSLPAVRSLPPPHKEPTAPGPGARCHSAPSRLSPALPARAVAPPNPTQASGTLGRKEVDEDGNRGNEDAGRDDVDDVEEGLALDEQVEDHLLVARRLGRGLGGWQHLGRPVPDGPLPVLCGRQPRAVTRSGLDRPLQPDVTPLQAAGVCPKDRHRGTETVWEVIYLIPLPPRCE